MTTIGSKQIATLGLPQLSMPPVNQSTTTSRFRSTSTQLKLNENRCFSKFKPPRSAEKDKPLIPTSRQGMPLPANPQTNEGQETMKNIENYRRTRDDGQIIQNQRKPTNIPLNERRTAVSPKSKQHLRILGPHSSFERSIRGVSSPQEGNLRYLHIPKLTVCQIFMTPLSKLLISCNLCSLKRLKVFM